MDIIQNIYCTTARDILKNYILGASLLDWNNIADHTDDIRADIIIGADIVYDPTILQPLCNVLKTFCEKNKNVAVYIASVVRNEDTFSRFLKTLSKY